MPPGGVDFVFKAAVARLHAISGSTREEVAATTKWSPRRCTFKCLIFKETSTFKCLFEK